MVQSAAASVDAYIAEAAPERAPYLVALRNAALANLPGYVEQMQYGMAAYVREGGGMFAFANQKQHLSLYGLGAAARALGPELLAGIDHGKGCIRFRNPAKMDMALIERLLRHAAEHSHPGR